MDLDQVELSTCQLVRLVYEIFLFELKKVKFQKSWLF